jgi:hypothetical protein
MMGMAANRASSPQRNIPDMAVAPDQEEQVCRKQLDGKRAKHRWKVKCN